MAVNCTGNSSSLIGQYKDQVLKLAEIVNHRCQVHQYCMSPEFAAELEHLYTFALDLQEKHSSDADQNFGDRVAGFLASQDFIAVSYKLWDLYSANNKFTSRPALMLVTVSWAFSNWEAYASELTKQYTIQHFLKTVPRINAIGDSDSQKVVRGILSTAHNCLRYSYGDTHSFRECGVQDFLKDLIKNQQKGLFLHTMAAMVLCYILSEEELEKFAISASISEQLIHMLKISVDKGSCEIEDEEFTTLEVLSALKNMAMCKGTAFKLIRGGILTPLTTIIKNPNSEGVTLGLAINCVYTLSFSSEAQEKINTPELITSIRKLAKNKKIAHSIKKDCEGILWQIFGPCGTFNQSQGGKSKRGSTVNNEMVPMATTVMRHVMISYQWDSQPLALKLNESLKRHGYSVWIDVEKMKGDIFEKMAEAIQNSEAVLICVTEKYKNSNNCRSEAEYAKHLNKKMVPLMMQKCYSPDGWLGLLIAPLLYYPVLKEESVNELLAMKLSAELGAPSAVELCTPSSSKQHSIESPDHHREKFNRDQWIKNHNLTFCEKALKELTQAELEELISLMKNEPIVVAELMGKKKPEDFLTKLNHFLKLRIACKTLSS